MHNRSVRIQGCFSSSACRPYAPPSSGVGRRDSMEHHFWPRRQGRQRTNRRKILQSSVRDPPRPGVRESGQTVIPEPRETLEVAMGDGATIRVRRHGRPDGIRLFVSNGNGFAVDGYYPFWGALTDRFDVIAFDFRNHGANPPAPSGRDGHTYAQMTLDLERVRRAVEDRLGPRPAVGVFHSMSARTAMKHAIELGFPWTALILFDPPNVPPRGHSTYDAMDIFERRLADWALRRQDRFDDPSELARQYAETRAHSNWVPGAHALMATSVLRRVEDGAGRQ